MKKNVIISLVGIVIIVVIVSAGTGLCNRENEPENTRITATVTQLEENTSNVMVGYSFVAHLSDGTVIYVARKDKCRYKVGTTVVYERYEEAGKIAVWERIPPPLPDIDPATAQYCYETANELKWFSGMEDCERSEWVRDQCRILYAKGEISKEELDSCWKYNSWVESILVSDTQYNLQGTPYYTIFDMPMIDVLRIAIERQRTIDR